MTDQETRSRRSDVDFIRTCLEDAEQAYTEWKEDNTHETNEVVIATLAAELMRMRSE